MRVIVTGYMAQYPLGGMAWHYLQYVLGLSRMGHDAYYFEDTGLWPYSPAEQGVSKSCDFSVTFLTRMMERFGLSENWAYLFPGGPEWFGLTDAKREDVVGTADLVINISFSLARPEEYKRGGKLVCIDSDPVFTQAKLAAGHGGFEKLVEVHDTHFSFAQDLTHLPFENNHDWLPTRQPVVISEWEHDLAARPVFTTVMNWTSYKPVKVNGHAFGQKDVEFRKFVNLPERAGPADFEIAMNAAGKVQNAPLSLLKHKGWRVVEPDEVCPDYGSYRKYIQTSMGEWSVAKNGYVDGRVGWFSERSACYLAAARPVILQDTGFSRVLPTGRGLLAFQTLDQATEAVKEVRGDYERHASAARDIANDYFDSKAVLEELLSRAI